jgi:predicted AAA+ superfamily ATPase
VKKEKKSYLYDWSVVRDEGARFENLLAVHLLKYTHFLQESEGLDVELHYYRDTTPREVDFVITRNGAPWKVIECRISQGHLSPHLRYFKTKFKDCSCEQISLRGDRSYISPEGIVVRDALSLLRELV